MWRCVDALSVGAGWCLFLPVEHVESGLGMFEKWRTVVGCQCICSTTKFYIALVCSNENHILANLAILVHSDGSRKCFKTIHQISEVFYSLWGFFASIFCSLAVSYFRQQNATLLNYPLVCSNESGFLLYLVHSYGVIKQSPNLLFFFFPADVFNSAKENGGVF